MIGFMRPDSDWDRTQAAIESLWSQYVDLLVAARFRVLEPATRQMDG